MLHTLARKSNVIIIGADGSHSKLRTEFAIEQQRSEVGHQKRQLCKLLSGIQWSGSEDVFACLLMPIQLFVRLRNHSSGYA